MPFVRRFSAALGTACAVAVFVAAAPSPRPSTVPGGANQVDAVSGSVGDTLFNGVVRLQVQELRDAVAADHPEAALPGANQRVMVLTALVRNGTHAEFTEVLTYTLADADDVAFEIPSYKIAPNPVHMLQASAAKQHAVFLVDAAYHPTKLVVTCTTCSKSAHFRAFRLAIPAASAAPSPIPS
ncbi:MAG: MoaD/ThiS family protein [Candidatus Eremiobacteraeota bacterium]|nr:MoaD/ThiS family protein [Candidatus Eremiobacteraeota bacterium]